MEEDLNAILPADSSSDESDDEVPIIELFHMDPDAEDAEDDGPQEEPPCEITNFSTVYNRPRGSYKQTFRLVKVPVMHSELNPHGPEFVEQGCLLGCYKDSQNNVLATDAITIMKAPFNNDNETSVHLNYCSHTNYLLPIVKPKEEDSKEHIYSEDRVLPKRKNYQEEGDGDAENSCKKTRNE